MSGKGKVCLITGASKGAGKGIAKVLASNGVYVVLLARSTSLMESLLKEIEADGGKGMAVTCCISKWESVKEMAEKVVAEVGVPDILVNNAGAWSFEDFCESEPPSWDWMIDVNIKGHLNMIRAFLPDMKKRKSGHIVNITSDSERIPWAGVSVYTGTKFFMNGCMASLRMELKGSGVKITNVLPGFIWTEGLEGSLRDPKYTEAFNKFGFGDPEELIKNKDLMLQPIDMGNSVWDIVKSPDNFYVYDVMLRDRLQEM